MALLEPATVPIKDDVCAKLAGMRPNLSARGISSLSLFGSVARWTASNTTSGTFAAVLILVSRVSIR